MRAPQRLLLFAVLFTLVAIYTERTALANGRFPKADAIATVPGGDGSVVFMRSTFGILLSNDGGKTWTWLCEQALGFSGTWDPPITATRDGRLWAGLADGLRVTKDGCDVREIPELKGELVADLSTDARGDRVIAITSTPDKPAHVWRSAANGVTFEKLGKGIQGYVFDTLDQAPSRPARVYLTAIPTTPGPRAHLFRSDDGGATLKEVKLKDAKGGGTLGQKDAGPGALKDGRLFLSAIDPKNPDRILVRHVNAEGSNLLLSADAGETFSVVLHTEASMFGFAKSEDGVTYWVGSGDPKEGIYRSVDRGDKWENVAKTSVLCLHAAGARLFACSNPYARGGYAIGVSIDGGRTLSALGTFDDVRGAVVCDSGAGTKCPAAWNDVRASIASSARAPSTPPPGSLDAGSDAAAAAGDAGPASTASNATTPSTQPSSKCGCRASGGSGSSTALIAVTMLAIRRRRTARSGCADSVQRTAA